MNRAPTASTRVAAVLGSPVRHSLSPAIHNRAFAELGADWVFVASEVARGGAAAALAAMETLGIGGYAITTPLKEEMAEAVDQVDRASEKLGSVNTVYRRPDGVTIGASTDGDGFVDSLGRAGVDVTACPTAVLGAGAAARSIVDALARADSPDIVVINRTEAGAVRAAELAGVARVGTLSDLRDVGVVVNATSVGMGATGSPEADATPVADATLLRPDLVVADIVYHPLRTRLLSEAAANGAKVIDGLGMLVCQAQLQQRYWVGDAGSYATLRAAAQAELVRR